AADQVGGGEGGQQPCERGEGGRGLLEAQLGLVAAAGGVDRVALRFEIVAKDEGEGLLVLDDQDAGRHALRRPLVALPTCGTACSSSRWCRPWGVPRRACALPPCSRRSRRCWSHGRPCARCSWRRTPGGCSS